MPSAQQARGRRQGLSASRLAWRSLCVSAPGLLLGPAGHSWCLSHGVLYLLSPSCGRHRQVQIADWSDEVTPNTGRASEARRRIPGKHIHSYAPPLQIRQKKYFSLHSYTRARRAVGPRIGTACFAHQHYSDWQSYFVRVVGNRCYFRPFRLDFPTTRTKMRRVVLSRFFRLQRSSILSNRRNQPRARSAST